MHWALSLITPVTIFPFALAMLTGVECKDMQQSGKHAESILSSLRTQRSADAGLHKEFVANCIFILTLIAFCGKYRVIFVVVGSMSGLS